MWSSALWGLVQGLTEFLPISSSGHLVLVPALLHMDQPDLQTSAVLHLGTLVAVLVYFRTDLARLLRFRTDPGARHDVILLAVATLPAALFGAVFESRVSAFQESPTRVALALIVTGVILLAAARIRRRQRTVDDMTGSDVVVIGLAQATALLPGISRSGTTIVAGIARGLSQPEAARFSFLLAIPAIFGAGVKDAVGMGQAGTLDGAILLGLVVAAIAGYASIALLLRLLRRTGLSWFAVYCLVFGSVALVFT